MLFYRLDNRIGIKSAAIVIDKLSLRIHQVKNNCVINLKYKKDNLYYTQLSQEKKQYM